MRDFATLAVVIPCYRAAGHLDALLARLLPALDQIDQVAQVVLVDDGSPDGTWTALKKARDVHGERLTCIRLASNMGQHTALLAGLNFLAPGVEIVVTMDDDLQHPPEFIGALIAGLGEDADIVIAAFEQKMHQAWRNAGGGLVDRTLRAIYNLPADFQLTSFRAFRRYVADHATTIKTNYPYVTAALLSATTRRRNVFVEHAPRLHGSSGYTLFRSLRLATNLFFTYSKYPLYAVLIAASVSLIMTLGLGFWVVAGALSGAYRVSGWASIMAMLSFGNSVVLACLCVFGVYVSRFHRELSGVGGRYQVTDSL